MLLWSSSVTLLYKLINNGYIVSKERAGKESVSKEVAGKEIASKKLQV